ncbi:MAG: response regulator [Rhodoplanes sp.]|uniref:hybrid sensor histidine kinase/response regulator n=1 Tax=Rhodoplanes sp. TaxID=1968906 RepID=UPI00183612E4|nr:hybrid sensor histidine kinase/response regulator [Rhodoplanes sp.]NVO15836.1 response regulator [Rhodoplanes sp.]
MPTVSIPFSNALSRTFAAARGVVRRPLGPHGVILLGLACIAVIWAGAIYEIHEERRFVAQDAHQTTSNLARAFEEHIIRSVRGVDQTLLYVREIYSRDPQGFDVRPWARASEVANDFAFQLSVIDRNGRLVTSSLDPLGTNGVDLSDRDHIRVHLRRDDDILFISEPVLGRVSNKWSINISRRIEGPDGRLLGIAVVSVDPTYLARFYDSIDVGRKGIISLVGTDAVVRIRVGNGSEVIGKRLAGSPLFAAFSRAPAGVVEAQSSVDGVQRTFSYRKVKDLPLIVLVGLADEEVYATFGRNRAMYLGGALVLSIGLVIVIVMIQRYQRGLQRAAAAAEAAVRARSDFIAVISHEIRTPLNGVIGMAGLLTESGLTGEQARFAGTLRDSAEHLLHLVDDVLDFSKLDAGCVVLEEIPFDLAALVEGTLRGVGQRAAAKGLALAAVLSPELPRTVVGDPGRLRQVLLNMLTNGIKFTETGGITVDVVVVASRAPRRIGIAVDVVDSGIGIAPEAMGGLFAEFQQADSSVSRRFGGTGLGLAICKRLIERMGGTITVDSAVGRGTAFRVVVDVGLPDAEAPLLGGVATTAPRVLVIDRNGVSRSALVRQLALLGAEVSAADTRDLGVSMAWDAAVTAQPFTCIALDETVASGDIIASLQAEPCMATTRLVLLTSAAAHERVAGADETFDAVLGKPLGYAAVRGAIVEGSTGAEAFDTRAGVGQPPLGTVHPLRILVAEDNPTNQLVVQKLLEGLGYAIDLVPDGAAALAAVKAAPYDLVFMDMMMPGMDGLQATRAIRALPEPERRVHVVALTANAFKHDAETCRIAGMNDFVGKPITRDRLEAAIRRYLGLRVREPAAVGTGADVAATFDRGTFALLGEEIGPDGARQVLATFMSDSRARVAALREHVAARAAGDVEHEAHTLKGAAGTLGFACLAEIARQLEQDAKAGRDRNLDDQVRALSAAFDELAGVMAEIDETATSASIVMPACSARDGAHNRLR